MALRFQRLREISRILPQIHSGSSYQQCTRAISSAGSDLVPLSIALAKIVRSFEERSGCRAQRFSTVSEISQESSPEVDLLSFIKSTLGKLEGPYHCWLNKVNGGEDYFKREGIFLVLAGVFLEDCLTLGCDPVIMFEKVKSLQQRYPLLNVLGFQSGGSICSAANQPHLVHLTMKEYITFPILFSEKNFSEMKNGPCYILFKDFRSPLLYPERSADLGILMKAIEDLNMQQNENSGLLYNLKGTGLKQTEVIKEPYICSAMQNLLLYFPGCISVDEHGNRLFLSDSNHHRIIIFDGNGKILDCIGSSPGFEDGEFESSKLLHPAASFYHADEDCLYFVDSENHAIRRADMGRRVLDTLYPTCYTNRKTNTLWSWITNKLGLGRNADTKSEEFDSKSLMFPWHLMKSTENCFLIINRSFETLWTMDSASGEIKEVVKGFPKILEICGQMIMEKVSLLKQMPCDWLQQCAGSNSSLEGIPYAGLMSSLAMFQDHIIICDTVGQRVLKFSGKSGVFSNFQFSNFGILGLPYWLAFSLERVYSVGDVLQGAHADHIQHFSLLPGRIDIQIRVDIPADTELVEPLHEGCVWRQARGAATEVSGAEGKVASSEKVGVAQQWYDELDNLAFETTESKLNVEEDNISLDGNFQDDQVHIDCAVKTSPGTSEVIIYAALYLRLRRNLNSDKDSNRERIAERMVDILNPEKKRSIERDFCIQFLLNSNRDLDDLIFMKPLHMRIKLDTLDHPKADNSKEIILTDSSVEVNVSLNS
ncbi:hypothetical protein L1049_005469 [Liquidambar formosana]|uniref:NHL repeat-containing protein 2 n=1 Tax=Liquidambar formosana TaxID=63359 RepID=A0AAP0X1G8_LIQFO